MINPIPETVSDSKFANFQEEMQGELDNGISNKGNNFTNISANFYLNKRKIYLYSRLKIDDPS